MRLGELAARAPGAVVSGDPALEIEQGTHDSRRVRRGALFVAIRGRDRDGNAFVEAARRNGAAAIASQEPAREGVPWLQVPDTREALALLSAAALGDPALALTLVGVTGTNGKT